MTGVVAVASCGILDPVVCTEELRAGIVVDVVDSVSRSRVKGRLTVLALEGSYADTAYLPNFPPPANPDTIYFGPFPLAWERAGTYQVQVRAPGYRDWVQSGVRVTADECHVRTRTLEALLQR